MSSKNHQDWFKSSVSPYRPLLRSVLPTVLLPLTGADLSPSESFPQPAPNSDQFFSADSVHSTLPNITESFITPMPMAETIALQPLITDISSAHSQSVHPIFTETIPPSVTASIHGVNLAQRSDLLAISTTENESPRDFQVLSVLALLSLGVAAVAMSWVQSRRTSEPLRELSIAAEQVAAGSLEMISLSSSGTTDVNTVTQSLNVLMRQVKRLQSEQETATQYANLLTEITSTRIVDRHDVKKVFNKALEQVRQLLQIDRVVVYRFRSDWSGYIANESVSPGLPRAIHDAIDDPCIPQELLEGYKNDRVVATSDVLNAGFHPKHRELMERLKIRANLVVPILNEDRLFGLLVAHDCTQPHTWQPSEINILSRLAIQFGAILDRLSLLEARENEAKRSQFLKDITLGMTQADTAELVFSKLPVSKIRSALQADRVIIYQFDESWKGTIIAESVEAGYPKALGATIYDPCFAKDYVEKYQAGRVQATPNIYAAGLTECHLRQLEPFAVKANLVAPINQGNRLLGLLIAHQCSEPRTWEPQEIAFFSQAATQVGLALDRAHLLEQRKQAVEQAQIIAEEQRLQRENLQNQLIRLLDDVEGAAHGDLTVRAEVTSSEIGTVADFFNSIVESLRQIVNNVKGSALKVSSSISDNREAIRQLSDTALVQSQEITLTLKSVQQVMNSIELVASSAQEASIVAGQASQTSEMGQAAVDRAVQNILSLRDVIGETAKKVKRLGESSQEISKVVSLIEQIALQTNLLSINAGIEAARAGEEGQGFAAVAEEIGKLAAQSATATRDIEDMIRSIQLETNEVVAAMERSTLKVVEGTHLVEDAKKNLSEILTVSQHIDTLVRSITEATVSQTQTSQVVTNRIKGIALVTEQNANASRRVAASLQQAIDLAHELETSVGRFHVG
ncbi:methyl-accepting chemotaxis protein [filamentous cyanobacterium CCP2]|nr:methyl-accepting chemotaxis protein [filamentous cyanobacterium CCP2]